MECYVDGGRIVKVRGVTPRDCARLALAELGDAAKFPMTLHLPIGDEQIFVIDESGNLAGTLADVRDPDAEAMQQANEAWETVLDSSVRCAVCGCTDLTPCPGGCYWTQATEGLLNLCSSCSQ